MALLERVPSFVFELSFQSPNEQSLKFVHGVLLTLGISIEEITWHAKMGQHIIKVFSQDSNIVKRVRVLFRKLDLPRLIVRQSRLRPQDWLTRWKEGWKPAALTKKIDVVPVWYKKKYKQKENKEIILMDTLLSFGTGLHETTQIVSQMIEDRAGTFNDFLDIGTGTGILSIVAIKSGARRVLAIDIGDLSVKAAQDNMRVNRITDVKVRKADIKNFRCAKLFDFVVANLITHDLISYASQILKCLKPNGYLAVSGISLEHLTKLQKEFKKLPLTRVEVVKRTQWSGLLYQKKTS